MAPGVRGFLRALVACMWTCISEAEFSGRPCPLVPARAAHALCRHQLDEKPVRRSPLHRGWKRGSFISCCSACLLRTALAPLALGPGRRPQICRCCGRNPHSPTSGTSPCLPLLSKNPQGFCMGRVGLGSLMSAPVGEVCLPHIPLRLRFIRSQLAARGCMPVPWKVRGAAR